MTVLMIINNNRHEEKKWSGNNNNNSSGCSSARDTMKLTEGSVCDREPSSADRNW